MEYRRLGKTGMKVSELCMGTMQFGWTADEAESFDILSAAFDAGINFIDTADIYSSWVEGNPGGVSETIIGKWLRHTGIPRNKLVIATKVQGAMGEGPNDRGLSRIHIQHAVEASLERLGVDTIDLYQAHGPDEDTPLEETLEAFDHLVSKGLVRYVGLSNYRAWQLVQALWMADQKNLAKVVCLQPHYSLIHRAEFERELEAVCLRYGIGVIPYSPLGGGFLTGKYRKGEEPPQDSRGARSGRIQAYMRDEAKWNLLKMLEQLGEARGKSISQMALGWLLSRPAITSPIIGPRSMAQLEDNLGAAGLRLDEEELAALDAQSMWQ